MTAAAARSLLRSATGSARSATAKLSAGVRPRTVPSPFRVSCQKPPSARIFRSMCSVSIVSMFPYHTATASALLNSMLSAPSTQGWTILDPNDDC